MSQPPRDGKYVHHLQRNPGLAPGGGPSPAKRRPGNIPTEWKLEMPEEYEGEEAGGCRRLEIAYANLSKLGEGTYGEVFKATDLVNGDVVAAKRIKLEDPNAVREGFPITAIREIKILSKLAFAEDTIQDSLLRDNIIMLRDIVRSDVNLTSSGKGSIYMMFDYMQHDMEKLLKVYKARNQKQPFTLPQVKRYMQQLFFGLALLEKKKILHRDMKTANLLVNNNGELKIADFGLARYLTYSKEAASRATGSSNPRDKASEGADANGPTAVGGAGALPYAADADTPATQQQQQQQQQQRPSSSTQANTNRKDPRKEEKKLRMTNTVCTLWYRPPEVCLGTERYGAEVDIWSAGCIMVELLAGTCPFRGGYGVPEVEQERDQLEMICKTMGVPTEENLPGCSTMRRYNRYIADNPKMSSIPRENKLRWYLQRVMKIEDPGALQLLEKLLVLDPDKRIGATAALSDSWFFSKPLPASEEEMPKVFDSHQTNLKPIPSGVQQQQQQHRGTGSNAAALGSVHPSNRPLAHAALAGPQRTLPPLRPIPPRQQQQVTSYAQAVRGGGGYDGGGNVPYTDFDAPGGSSSSGVPRYSQHMYNPRPPPWLQQQQQHGGATGGRGVGVQYRGGHQGQGQGGKKPDVPAWQKERR